MDNVIDLDNADKIGVQVIMKKSNI